jgi:hypothetical protein
MRRTRFLFDAIERYYTLMVADHPDARREFEELRRWFESHELRAPDTFEWLCRQHNLDAQLIRRMLRRRYVTTSRD